MMKSISIVAAVATALCFATTVYAAGHKGPQSEEDDTPKPLPALQKNFPLDQTCRSRSLTASLCHPEWTSA